MSYDPPTTLDPLSSQSSGNFARNDLAPPTIEGWSVAGHDRIVGTLRDMGSPSHGRKIITSPVMRVRLAGADGTPVAQTQSGSRYALAIPAASFGAQNAEHFVRFKCAVPSAHDVPPVDPAMRTGLMKLPS